MKNHEFVGDLMDHIWVINIFFLDLGKEKNNNISCMNNHIFEGDFIDHIWEVSALVMEQFIQDYRDTSGT